MLSFYNHEDLFHEPIHFLDYNHLHFFFDYAQHKDFSQVSFYYSGQRKSCAEIYSRIISVEGKYIISVRSYYALRAVHQSKCSGSLSLGTPLTGVCLSRGFASTVLGFQSQSQQRAAGAPLEQWRLQGDGNPLCHRNLPILCWQLGEVVWHACRKLPLSLYHGKHKSYLTLPLSS